MKQIIHAGGKECIYIETIKGEVPDCFSVKNGYWVIHEGNQHHVYKETCDVKGCIKFATVDYGMECFCVDHYNETIKVHKKNKIGEFEVTK